MPARPSGAWASGSSAATSERDCEAVERRRSSPRAARARASASAGEHRRPRPCSSARARTGGAAAPVPGGGVAEAVLRHRLLDGQVEQGLKEAGRRHHDREHGRRSPRRPSVRAATIVAANPRSSRERRSRCCRRAATTREPRAHSGSPPVASRRLGGPRPSRARRGAAARPRWRSSARSSCSRPPCRSSFSHVDWQPSRQRGSTAVDGRPVGLRGAGGRSRRARRRARDGFAPLRAAGRSGSARACSSRGSSVATVYGLALGGYPFRRKLVTAAKFARVRAPRARGRAARARDVATCDRLLARSSRGARVATAIGVLSSSASRPIHRATPGHRQPSLPRPPRLRRAVSGAAQCSRVCGLRRGALGRLLVVAGITRRDRLRIAAATLGIATAGGVLCCSRTTRDARRLAVLVGVPAVIIAAR